MKLFDFLIATGSLVISTRFSLSQHEELLDTWTFPHLITNPSINTIFVPPSSNHFQASELLTKASICLSAALVAWIYDAAKHEKLRAPMYVLAFGASIYFWIKTAASADIYLFVIFPWMLLIGLLVSRLHDTAWRMEGVEDRSASNEKMNSSFIFELVPGS
ncbi:hypothetical protein sscle_14g097830 [Sclerotinia sclerotiorum 1980 UF-70]|uniref:Uncharacterized protein n=1 Tax=Sclerotinia sclerotiorum (strain ATCC 18683 / 1980 / Ss-1) TaxID=665079 RepID=A0A1D9QK79_SCLS1|nr:hypothetical protein sscle_14g097830 [Sclerotinia sclerotiorum 1980 UF-70]